ncbi:glycosyl hydrolase [Halorubellus litoreus]|uniref:glucan endo-1,3-beta-D-glucosidase n=1 Tax=Halorubellus litoreus TaxID=755308 RepID=A0ABD5VLZ7_9EURY
MTEDNQPSDDGTDRSRTGIGRRDFAKTVGLLGGLSSGVAGTASLASAATSVSVGNGSYTTTLPSGEGSPPDTTYTTGAVSPPVPTNEWWSSLVWKQHSMPIFAHPVSMEFTGSGLDVWHGTEWTYSDGYDTDSVATLDQTTDLTIGHSATSSFGDARCDGFGDWHTVGKFGDGTSTTLRTTVAQGSPYVFCEYAGGDAKLTFPSAPTVFADEGNVLGVEVNGHAYGLYAPSDATWSGKGTTELTSTLGSAGYLTVAVLPEATSTALADLEAYAYNHVTDTTVDWTYDEASGDVTTTFDFAFDAKPESSASGTFTGLFPHQHKYSSASFTGYTYASARGTMKTTSGVSSFTTTYTFPGVLPFLPDEGTYDDAELASYVDEEESNSTLVETGPDKPGDGTYWTGKNYGRLSELIPIAEQVGDATAASYFLDGDSSTVGLRGDLETWLDADRAGSTRSEDVFYYDDTWGTLVGYNDSFGSGADINDHHFHYGYYVRGAAEVARHDPTWAEDANWGGMVELLVADYANWKRPDRSNALDPASNPHDSFPFLRNFSPYEGHSWASGSGDYEQGNNQESSSEAINAYTSMLLWAEYTGNTAMRDAAVYLYTTEVHAIKEYWYDEDGTNLPADWPYDYAAMVWSNGVKYDTWWTGDVEAKHGINVLPVTAGRSYLGWDTDAAAANYQELVANDPDGDDFQYWPDVMWEYRALSDVDDAKSMWTANKDSYPVEFGESRAHTYHWIYNHDAMGTATPSVTADHALASVYDDGSARTHVAYNPTGSQVTVNFSDGVSLDVPANSMATDSSNSGDSSAPTLDSLSATEVETSDSDAEFDVSWSVGDADGDLSTVDLTLTDDTDGSTEDTASISVSGSDASGTTRLVAVGDEGSANSYTVDAVVTDAAGASSAGSTAVSETESSTGGNAPTVDGLSLTERSSNSPHAEFDASYSVSDANGDLSTVDLTLTDTADGVVEDSASIGVSGGSASDTVSLKAFKAENDGHTYELECVVADAAGNTATATASEVEDGS